MVTFSSAASFLRSVNFHLLRRVLHLWIRPQVINASADKLNLRGDLPVCYVLPSRSLADLLVVDHACELGGLPLPHEPLVFPRAGDGDPEAEARAFFFLSHREGRWFSRRSYRGTSPRLRRVLGAHERRHDLDVQLVPVSLFWGHAPEREKSLLKLLLSDNWTATSRLKKFLALCFQPGHILVRFSAPLSLRELTDAEPDARIRARKLGRILRVHFRRRKQAIIGPDLSHRRTMVGTIVSSRSVQQAIAATTAERGLSLQEATALARSHANEIAADQSYRVIRFLYVVLTWFWSRLYRGFVVNGIDRVQELAEGHELVYVPTHRSHIDYLVLSYLLYTNGLPPPHIAAGKNMNIPLVGGFLRRGGAFFMRRSFQDDPLYKAVFDEYLHMIFSKGYSVEYFIEGGRSRTGRMLSPRMGLLGMTVRSFQRKPSPPLAFVPVYIGYERVLEAATYIGELRGAEKKDESIRDIINVMRFLNLEFGKVHVNFGRPLQLAEFLTTHLPGWTEESATSREALHVACEELGHQLAVRINAAAAVTPVNLLAVILLATSKQRIASAALHRQIDLFRELLLRLHQSDEMSVTDLPAEEVVALGERLGLIARMDAPHSDVLAAEGDRTVLLTYYRNNVAHLLVLPSLLLRVLTSRDELEYADLLATCSALYPYLAREYYLPWSTVDAAALCAGYLNHMKALELIEMEGSSVRAAPRGSEQYTSLLLLSEVVEPSLQRFFIAARLIEAAAAFPVTQSHLEQGCRMVAQEVAAVYRFNAPEFFQQTLFSTFLTELFQHGAVRADEGVLVATETLAGMLGAIDPLLDRDIRQGIHEAVTRSARKLVADTRQIGSSVR